MKNFSGNVRNIAGINDDELRASLKAAGWNKLLPAIKDEHGEVLVGHRRLKIAAEENIDPVIEVHTFGSGPDADNDRLQLAIVSNTGAAPLTSADRKRHAERMYSGGMTMDSIGRVLGVSQKQISRDLEGLDVTSKPPRPKGGRPKSEPKTRAERAPKAIEREERVAALKDEGMTVKEISRVVGLGERAVNQALEHVEIKREAIPHIDREELNLTQKKRADIYIRQTEAKLKASFQKAVIDEVRHRIDEIILPDWKKKVDEAKKIYNLRRKFMSKETFNMIRRGLHPDSRHSISDKKLAEAFDAFMALEKFLLDEEASPTEIGEVPSNLAEWDKMKANARTSKRANGATAVRRR